MFDNWQVIVWWLFNYASFFIGALLAAYLTRKEKTVNDEERLDERRLLRGHVASDILHGIHAKLEKLKRNQLASMIAGKSEEERQRAYDNVEICEELIADIGRLQRMRSE